jgi:Leucine-rich repeat (LRR) protein
MPVQQGLQELPESLAVAVLLASPVDLGHQLSILPESLHQHAINAAYPSIRRHHSLTLERNEVARTDRNTAYQVLQHATTAGSPLKKLVVRGIPILNNKHLLQPITAACKLASAVQLIFEFGLQQDMHHPDAPGLQWQLYVQLGDALSTNTALTSLDLTACRGYRHRVNFDCMSEVLTGLPNLTQLQELRVKDFWMREVFPPVATLAALQILELRDCRELLELPPLDGLTALQTLEVTDCEKLQRLPLLDSLTALQTLDLSGCKELKYLPPLATLTALEYLTLGLCSQLQQLPLLNSLTALQVLELDDCPQLELPSLDNLKAMEVLRTWDSCMDF